MPLPPLDAHGNLSVGQLFARGGRHYSMVPTTMDELHGRFVDGGAARRSLVWDGFRRHRALLDALPLPYTTLVNGSFTTSKREPNDIDICILYEAEVFNATPPAERAQVRALFDRTRAAREFYLDLYHVPIYRFDHPRFPATCLPQLSYWTRVFGVDRLGRQKCIPVLAAG